MLPDSCTYAWIVCMRECTPWQRWFYVPAVEKLQMKSSCTCQFISFLNQCYSFRFRLKWTLHFVGWNFILNAFNGQTWKVAASFVEITRLPAYFCIIYDTLYKETIIFGTIYVSLKLYICKEHIFLTFNRTRPCEIPTHTCNIQITPFLLLPTLAPPPEIRVRWRAREQWLLTSHALNSVYDLRAMRLCCALWPSFQLRFCCSYQ